MCLVISLVTFSFSITDLKSGTSLMLKAYYPEAITEVKTVGSEVFSSLIRSTKSELGIRLLFRSEIVA